MNVEKFRTYQDTQNESERRRLEWELIREYEPKLRRLVSAVHRANVSIQFEDFLQAGWIGLHTALKKWDPEGAPFWITARQWVLHECQGALQSQHGALRLPRFRDTVGKKRCRLARKAEAHYAKTGTDATPEVLGISQEQWTAINSFVSVKSLTEEGEESVYTLDAEELLDLKKVREVIDSLSPLERDLLLEEKTWRELEEEYGKHPPALKNLKKKAWETVAQRCSLAT